MTLNRIVTAALFGVAAAGLFAAPSAKAQTTTIIEDQTGAVDGGYDLPPEQETIIRRRIIQERLPPVELQGGTVRVGSIVPEDVELRPMTSFGSGRMARFAYFISPDEKIVVVEPRSRQVVRIMDADTP
ncbi:hypothetical protein SLNSH_21295 [Alsobacter soli]|uniref:DUF1236 domain-containing protein n=1 Tax=Alsobacter soli TaxID=2109933 RepID=A0A2T1HMR4_9HYPH|nr:DUF1236 domain-containing protein [Alsobacter soli]PSC02927.1 hypothetical protein SLNSH_21295 [Alsobacter soli]